MNGAEHRDVAALSASTADTAKLAELARRLRSPHAGDVAVVEAIAVGVPAIPVLRETGAWPLRRGKTIDCEQSESAGTQ